jgi:hypothetical protein
VVSGEWILRDAHVASPLTTPSLTTPPLRYDTALLDSRYNGEMPEPLYCPYCNAYVTAPPGSVEDGQRMLCTRCGETFTYHGPAFEVEEAQTQPTTPADIALVQTGTPWSNRAIAAIVFGLMASMAVGAVVIALATHSVRRSHDSGLPKDRTLPFYLVGFVVIWLIGLAFVAVRELRIRYQRSYAAQRLPLGYIVATVAFLAIGGLAVTILALQISKQRESRPPLDVSRAEVRVVAPAALAALGYIPGDCDLVAGIHVAEINDDPTVRDFLRSSSFIPGGSDLSFITNWTSLRPQDIDHAVLGLRIQGVLIPRFTLVVRTLRPYDAVALRKTSNASRWPGPSKREYYRVDSEKSNRRYLWFPDDRTVVVGLKNEDLDPVPAQPRDGIDHLPREQAGLIKDRLGAGTPLWITGQPENWKTQLALVGPFVKQLGRLPENLQKVKACGIWCQFNDGLTVNAAFECTDADAAGQLEKFFLGRGKEGNAFSLPPPTPQLAPLYQELGRNAKADRNESWLVMQTKASVETLRKAVAPP